ncbi:MULTISPECIES: multidrug efflux MFS transporter EmrD [Vibrio]|nr:MULTISPECIES: multidrug efflux MFS transporter EmrD [Vibrio]HBV75119.1 multidrug transporter EmrD [Vibrio sp.]
MSAPLSFIKLTFLIAILAAVGQMTQTMYVPSMGYMAREFSVSAASMQAVMACYLIPYGLSQFIYGPLSDRLGRRPIILTGLMIYILGSLAALFAHSFPLFLAASFIQGMGIGCGGAMARTLSRDCFSGLALHKVNSLISMCLIFSPLVAPLLGGYLTEVFHWRSSYLFLTLFSVGVTIIMFTHMKETLPKTSRRYDSVATSYRYVLGHRQFQGYLLCLVATFAGVALFEAAAGVLLGGKLKLPATTVSLLFILPIPGYLLGAAMSNWIASRHSEKRALNFGLVAIAIGSLVIFIPGVFGYTNALTLVGGATIYFLGSGVLFPAATTGAISPFPHHAGTAGALLGGIQNFGAGMATLIAAMMPAQNQLPLGALMLAMSLLAVIGLHRVNKTPMPPDVLGSTL